MRYVTGHFLFLLCFHTSVSFAQGDTLQEKCYQSMIYSISTQVAGNAENKDMKSLNTTGAFSSGKWLGIDPQSTERLIGMAGKDANSKKFATQYLTDKRFAESFRNNFLAGCHKKPSEYLLN